MCLVQKVVAHVAMAAIVGFAAAPAKAEGGLVGDAPSQASDRIASPRGSSAHGGGYSDTRATSSVVRSPTTRQCMDLCEAEPELGRMRACMIECVQTFGVRPVPSSGSVFIGAGLLATALGVAAVGSGLAGICDVTAGPEPDAVADSGCEVTLLAGGAGFLVLGSLLALIGIEQAGPFGSSTPGTMRWAF